MKKRVDKKHLSSCNKRKNNHKKTKKVHNEPSHFKTKKVKNRTETERCYKVNKNLTKEERKSFLIKFRKEFNLKEYNYKTDCKTCLGIGCKYCKIVKEEENGNDKRSTNTKSTDESLHCNDSRTT